MLADISIKSLYVLALAEGEGVGTAYEYFAKRLVLSSWLRQIQRSQRILIAGLPEKYGASLDFLQMAAELGAAVTVVDERPQAIVKTQQALAAAQAQGWLSQLEPVYITITGMAGLVEMPGDFDLCLSSEVLQRIAAQARPGYVARLQELAPAVVLFAPNAGNPSHTHLSGLSGLHLSELQSLLDSRGAGEQEGRGVSPAHPLTLSGYLDMPPFPPGIIRNEEQRAQASSGRLEGLAMGALGYYARLESFVPARIRRRQSHIVYAFSRRE